MNKYRDSFLFKVVATLLSFMIMVSTVSVSMFSTLASVQDPESVTETNKTVYFLTDSKSESIELNYENVKGLKGSVAGLKLGTFTPNTGKDLSFWKYTAESELSYAYFVDNESASSGTGIVGSEKIYFNNVKTDTVYYKSGDEFVDYESVSIVPNTTSFSLSVAETKALLDLKTVEVRGTLAVYGVKLELYEGENKLSDTNDDSVLSYSSSVLGKHTLTVKTYDALNQTDQEKDVDLTVYVRTERDGVSFIDEKVDYAKGLTVDLQNSGRTDISVGYSIISGEEVASIVNNQLKIKKPGTVTIEATVAMDDSHFERKYRYDVKVNKGNRKGSIVFDVPNPSDIKFNENENKFTNIATYISSVDEEDGEICYEIISGAKITSVDANGVLTVSGAGTVTVGAYMPADEYYNEYKNDFTYSITVLRADLPKTVTFSRTEKFDLTYGTEDSIAILNYKDVPDGINRIAFNQSNKSVKVVPIQGKIYNFAIIPLKVTNGVETITATVMSNNYQGELSFQYEVKPGITTITNIDDIEQTFTEDKTIQLSPVAKLGNSEESETEVESAFDYEIVSAQSIDGEEIAEFDKVATVDDSGKITVKRSGKFEVKVTATPVDKNYKGAVSTITVTINKADDSGFKFDSISEEEITVTYGENSNTISALAQGGKSTGEIKYVSSDNEVASVDKNGVVTVKKAGVTTITATKEADDCYNSSTVSFELTVNKADLSDWKYSFAKQTVLLGKTHTPVIPTDKYGVDVKYSVKAENNTAKAVINSDGKVVAKTVGTATIVAYFENDSRYNDAKAEYTLEVNFAETPQNPYTVKSDSKVLDIENGYNGTVTVEPATNLMIAFAPESWADADISTIEWQESIEFTENVKAPTFIFKYKDGESKDGITDNVSTEIKLDNSAPEGTITHKTNVFSNLVSNLFFGLFANKNTKLTVTASDNKSSVFESGVKSVEYFADKYSDLSVVVARSVDDLSQLSANSWTAYDEQAGIVFADDSYTVVYVKLTDNYGNSSFISTNGLIYENSAPSVTTKADEIDEDYGYYYNDISVEIDITDMVEGTAVYSGINTVDYAVYADGVEGAIYSGNLFKKTGSVIAHSFKKSFFIPVENNYDSVYYVVTVKDNCDNVTVVKSDTFAIMSKPVARFEYNHNDCTEKCKDMGNGYKLHNHIVEAEIYYPVSDAFDEDVLNGYVDDYFKNYKSVDKSGSWNRLNNSYVKKITFNDNSYTFDKAISFYGVSAVQDEALFKFIVDTTAPKIDISFDNNDAVRDNFYSKDRVASIKVEDANFVPADNMFTISATDLLGESVQPVPTVEWTNDREAKVEFTTDANYSFVYSVDNLIDLAGNRAVVTYSDKTTNPNKFTVDKTAPTNMTVTYKESESAFGTLSELVSKLTNGFIYFEKSVDVTVSVKDSTTAIDRFVYSAELDETAGVGSTGIDETIVNNVNYDDENNVYSVSFTVEPEYKGEIQVRAYDMADNFVDSNEDFDGIVVSDKKPVVTAEAKETAFVKDGVSYYAEDISVSVTVEDVNFDSSKVVMTETTKLNGEDVVTVTHGQNVTWTRKEGTNVYMTTVVLAGGTLKEGAESFKVEYTNNSKHTATPAEIGNMVIDRTAPTDMVITYKESESVFGTLGELISKLTNGFIYFGKSVEVEIKVADKVSPIDRFVYSAELDQTAGVGAVGIEETTTKDITFDEIEKVYKTTFTVSPEYKGKIKARAYDSVDHYIDSNEEYGIVVSDKVPVVTVKAEKSEYVTGKISYYSEDIPVTVTVEDVNFDASKVVMTETTVLAGGKPVETVTNGKTVQWARTEGTNVYTTSILLKGGSLGEGAESFKVEYTNNSGINAETAQISNMVIDRTAPTDMVITYKESESVFGTLGELISKLTNGFIYFGKSVEVEVKVADKVSPIDRFVYSAELDETAGVGAVGIEETTTKNITFDETEGVYKTTFTVSPEYKGKIRARAYDSVDHYIDSNEEYGIVVSDKVPVVTVKAEKSEYVTGKISYYSEDIPVTVTVEDVNFDASKVVMTETTVLAGGKPVETVTNGKTVQWQRTEGTNVYTTSILLKGGSLGEGAESFKVEYTNNSGISAETAQISDMVIDRTAPQVVLTYDNNNPVRDDYYNADRKVTIKVTDENFVGVAEMFNLTAVNLTGANVANAPKVIWSDDKNAVVSFSTEANYTFNYNEEALIDLAGNKAVVTYADGTKNQNKFTVDKTSPENMVITYKESESIFGTLAELLSKLTNGFIYFGKSVDVEVKVADATSPINRFVYSAELDQTAGVGAVGIDETTTENISYSREDNTYSMSFTISPEFKGEIKVRAYDMADNFVDSQEPYGIVVSEKAPVVTAQAEETDYVTDNIAYYSDDIEVTVTVEDVNFDASKVVMTETTAFAGKKDAVTVTNGKDVSWNRENGTNTYTTTIILAGGSLTEGYETFKVEYTNNSGIEAETVEIGRMIIDRTAPQVEITFANNSPVKDSYYNADRSASIKVTDNNFIGKEEMFVVTATNSTGADVENAPKVVWADSKNAVAQFTTEANYTFNYNEEALIDLAGNKAVVTYADGTKNQNKFTVDKTSPENMVITYTESDNIFGTLAELLSKLTNGFIYFGKSVEVKVTVADATSPIDRIVYSAELDQTAGVGSEGIEQTTVNDVNYNSVDNTYDISFTVAPEYKGKIFARAYDKAENYVDSDEQYGIVVSEKQPVITVEAEKSENIKDLISYYSGDIKVNVTVEDVNFDRNRVIMTETTEFEGENVLTVTNGVELEWVRKEGTNIYASSLLLKGGSLTQGVEQFKVEYTNHSQHTATPVEIGNMVIDRTAPKVMLEYDNNNVKNDSYFDSNRTLKISVTDHNFYGLENMVKITGVNKALEPVAEIPQIVWNTNGHTATIEFKGNADYTFNIDKETFVDLAGNKAIVEYAQGTESANAFTVDKIKPSVKVEFDNNSSLNGRYFSKGRTAKIVVSDDNFVGLKDMIVVTAVDKINESIENVPEIKWLNDKEGEITFTEDADYTFGFDSNKLIDLAGNKAVVSYAVGTKNQSAFTIDTIKPRIYIEYENNSFKNKNYYDAPRTVIVAVDDDNFIGSKNMIKITALNKQSEPIENQPVISWIDEKNCVVVFEEDADYTFDIVMGIFNDLAGNSPMVEYAEGTTNANEFVIDRTQPQVLIEYDNNNALNGKYYDSDRVATITVNDNNFNGLKDMVTVKAYDKNKKPIANIPQIKWNNKNVGQIVFTDEADYTFSVNENKFVDLAGNKSIVTYASTSKNVNEFTIDKTTPKVVIEYSNNKFINKNFYDNSRVATVSVTDDNFVGLKDMVKITALNKNQKPISSVPSINWISDTVGEIRYIEDAYYTFNIDTNKFVDLSGNRAEISYADGTTNENEFVVDKTNPNNFSIVVKTPDGKTLGDIFTDKTGKGFRFDNFSNKEVSVNISGNDNLTGLTLYYYISRKEMTQTELTALPNGVWNVYGGQFKVAPDRKMVIYGKAVDESGNRIFCSSDGIILDKTSAAIEGISPDIKLNPSSNKQKKDLNGNILYNGDVIVDYIISDPIVNDTCSGLDLTKLRYEVTNNNVVTQSGILEGKSSNYEGHIRSVSGQIKVDATLNNSNNVKLKVFAVDNATNESNKACSLRIDITAPEVSVSYANNTVIGDGFFNADRTATITVRERNFNGSKVKVTMTKDGVAQKPDLKWNNSGDSATDEYTHTATITYNEDADYTFDVSYVDEASNACSNVSYGNSVAPKEFTIDKTAPTVSVTYDNNSAQSNNYYNNNRTATITVVEHNFNPEGVTQAITASRSGQSVTAPQMSGWSNSGDTHTATITYSEEADYVFTFECTDMASNSLSENLREEFTVDKTAPELVIEGINYKSANNGDDGDISFTLRATDINLNNSSFVKDFIKINIDGKDEVVESVGELFNITNGVEFRVSNLTADSVYSIKCTVSDKAGNTTSAIKSQDVDNKPVEEDDFIFSVNRHGSTFMLDENTKKIVDKGFVKEITDDIVITEINPDKVNDYLVTLDNGGKKPRVLTDGEGYLRENKEDDRSWCNYVYKIKKTCFEEEAAYTLSLVTQDESGNKSYSTTSNPEYSDIPIAKVKFVVDRTKPQVVVTNIENNGRYNTEQQSVTVIAKDENILSSLNILLNGEVVAQYNSDQLVENRGEVSFVIKSSESLQNLEVVAVDTAGNSTNDDEESRIIISDFLITTNFFILFINNTPALIMAIVGILLIAAGIIFLIAKKKDKKDAAKS